MPGNSFGSLFKITTYGESHGHSLGVVIDGMPPNIGISEEDLMSWMLRRAPGTSTFVSARKEPDQVVIQSGVFEGKTLGTPIAAMVVNCNQNSSDYSRLKNIYRSGHADKVTQDKYKIRDYRGGGRASGRETVSRVIAGYFAKLLLPNVLIEVKPLLLGKIDLSKIDNQNEIENYLIKLKEDGDSCGVLLGITINNCPASLGDPVFDKLKATLAHAILSIGGCTSFSYGAGEEFASMLGSESKSLGETVYGGLNGGITTGEQIFIKAAFKAPSSIGEVAKSGRHDPCLYPRVNVVIESMIYIVLANHLLSQKVISEQ